MTKYKKPFIVGHDESGLELAIAISLLSALHTVSQKKPAAKPADTIYIDFEEVKDDEQKLLS